MVAFIHHRELLHEDDVVVVDCDHQCNVRLMDDLNFECFRRGTRHKYYGGFYRTLPAKIVVPATDYWNITLDLAGRQARVRHSIKFLKKSKATTG